MNATKAAIEEGVVVGGGCCLLRLSLKIDEVKKQLDNEEQKIGAEIFRHALAYPIRKIAENAGVNGSVVVQKVLSNDDVKYGYNAARDCYEDLMEGGIMDPTKVVRCCLEHAASVAKTFPISDAVAVDISEKQPLPRRPMSGSMPMPMPMPVSGVGPLGGF